MGCCISREAAEDNTTHPYPTVANARIQAPDDSSRNITASSPPQPASISSPRASHTSQAQTRPNAPLKPINPSYRSTLPNTLGSPTNTTSSRHRTHITPLTDSTTLQWTRARLERERNDWWDTRITGSPEIWNAVRLIVGFLQRGEVEQAQTLLDVTGCTCPNGEVWRGVFDEHGEWYKVPDWIVIEPRGLVEDEEEESGAYGDMGRTSEDHGTGAEPGDTAPDSRAAELKERESTSLPSFKVRCRFSSNQPDVVVRMHDGEPVSSLIRKLREKTGMKETTRLRIAFGGKLYDQHKSLESNPHFKHGLVLNVLVFE